MTFTAKHISVSINRPAAQVYEFVSNPENLPKWAAGLSGSIKKIDEDWIAESPMGTSESEIRGEESIRRFRSRSHFALRGQSL